MIKGCSRRMIVLKDTGSDFFEEAYFVLKSGKPHCKIKTERDFIAEAERIIAESTGVKLPERKKESAVKKYAFFAAGIIIGAAVFYLIYAL
ncbi:MAG: hypothetical protein IKV97_05770 [Clostridia bacterium]|nr:hypothetical protein [Clostridia bacterium]